MTTSAPTTTKPRKRATPKPVVELQPNPFVFEVFDLIVSQKTKTKKIEVIQKYTHESLIALWLWNYTSLQSALPAGEVPLTSGGEVENFPGEIADYYGSNHRTTIRIEFNTFYNFIRGGNDQLSGIRRETMFISLVQGLHPKEAEILVLVKDKKLQTKYPIDFAIIKEALPNVEWNR